MNTGSAHSKRRYVRRLVRVVALGAIFAGLAATPVAAATFSSGSTGADGAFNPTCTPTPCTVPVALPESGIFNFTTVNVPADVTVTYTRNAANTPVTILASGDVSIAGTINVSGQNAGHFGIPGRGGPGGFDGGIGMNLTVSVNGTAGLGPGGGDGGVQSVLTNHRRGAGGSFGTLGFQTLSAAIRPGPTYGLPTLLPLIGGSGGGGAGWDENSILPGQGGGGGGGAVLIASTGSINTTGRVLADGGSITVGDTTVIELGGVGLVGAFGW